MIAPLKGIRVVEVATWLAAPSAAAIMGDLGADVIKIESPQGDDYRWYLQHSREPGTVSNHFELDNRGKRSITVALDQPGAQDVMQRLLRDADIFITNLVRPRLQRYGLEYEQVRAWNSRIIFAALSGYGYRGPKSGRSGFDAGAFWAESGIMSLMGAAGTPLVQTRPGQGDHPTGLNLLAAILLALRVRDQTGESQFVDVSLQRTGAWTIANDVVQVANGVPQVPRMGTLSRGLVTWHPYETSDGRHVMLMMNQPQRFWVRFCRAIGREDWAANEEYATIPGLLKHSPALLPEVEAIFRTRTLADWMARLDEQRCLYAAVALLDELAADPQMEEYGAFAEIEHADGRVTRTLRAPFEVSGVEMTVRGPAPQPGMHTHEILTEAGFSSEEIAALAEQGVFG